MELIINSTILILFILGLYGLLTQRNIIKLAICFNIMEASILIFFLTVGYKPEGSYPIIRPEVDSYVQPLPQALALTAIVIGASTTALMLAFAIKLYKRYHTLDIDKLRRLRG